MTTPSARTATFEGADGVRISADVWGEGPPQAILLHGGGQTRGAWGRTGERFAATGVTTAAVDLRGHGESSWDPRGRYAFPDHARDLHAVVSACRQPVVLVGASLGGVTSLKLSELHPRLVRTVVLVDIAPTMQLTGVDRIVGFMGSNPHGFATLDEARAAIRAYQPHRKRPASDAGLKKNLRWSEATQRWIWHWDPRTLAYANPEWYRKQSRDMTAGVRALGDSGSPVILVRGEISDVILPADVARFRALGPHTQDLTVAGARHMVAGDENEVFLSEIMSALRPHVPEFAQAS